MIKFPKGRIDSMTTHIMKRCPAVSLTDRQRALAKPNGSLERDGQSKQLLTALHADQAGRVDKDASSSHSMSALETLAEVSRRHLDSTAAGPDPGDAKRRKTKHDEHIQAVKSFNDFVVDEHHIPTGAADQLQRDEAVERGIASDADEQLQDYIRAQDQITSSTGSMSTQQYAQLSSDRSETLAQQIVFQDQSNVGYRFDAHGQSMDKSSYGIDPQLQAEFGYEQGGDRDALPQTYSSNPETSTTPSFNPSQRLQASYQNDFSVTPGATRPKPRGRFSDSRRQEVREIRKQGACIRCRMLKKPCSGGTPCNTCKSVVSSRLWKQPCIRKRLGEEFDLYNAGVHNTIAYHEANRIKSTTKALSSRHHLKVTHAQASFLPPAELQVRRRVTLEASSENDKTVIYSPDLSVDAATEIESYIKQTRSTFIEHEPSQFMRGTLKVAEALLAEKHDALLDRAVELWTATQTLVGHSREWRITLDTTNSETQTQEDTHEQGHLQTLLITPTARPTSYNIIVAHLRSTTEKICAANAKILVNDLERRLLLRAQTSASNFETFLTSVILLNCVEKMCWLFHGWAQSSSTSIGQPYKTSADRSYDENSSANAAPGTSQQSHDHGPWHLDRSPASFVARCESIADILAMLLRVRGVPPGTRVDAEGILRAAEAGDIADPTMAMRDKAARSGRADAIVDTGQDQGIGDAEHMAADNTRLEDAGKGSGNSGLDPASVWLDTVRIVYKDVKAQQEQLQAANEAGESGRGWDAQDCRCWEMRFVGRLLV